jgi:hypothetical protein
MPARTETEARGQAAVKRYAASEPREAEPDPYRRLAQAVVVQAIKDARSRSVPEAVQREAQRFLDGGARLSFWAAVMGTTADNVRRLARVNKA